MVSCVGNDQMGKWVLATLAQEGIDTSQLAILPGKTAKCDIVVTQEGDRFFPPSGYETNVLSQLRLTAPIQRFIAQHDIAATQYGDGAADSLTAQLLQLPRNQVKRVIDFGDWSVGRQKPLSLATLDAIDLAFFSGDAMAVERLQPLAKRTNCLIIVTLGAGGSLALTASQPQFQPAIAVDNVIDTTGCGDAFQAAFTTNYFRDGNIANALLQGAHQAAQPLQHYGAFPQQSRPSSC